jgi:outer membrane immunogenic protein
MKYIALLAATAVSIVSVPAMAQSRDKSQDFDGGYISAVGGKALQPNDRGESLVFDTDGDGQFDNIVPNIGSTNAFASGFCNGAARNGAAVDCANDKDGAEYYARLGFDRRSGNFVIGALIEGGRNESTDAVSGSDGTDFYTMTRKAKWNAGARLRAGYTPGGGALFYVTGGGAYARLKNGFSTSNGANPITSTGNSNAWGWAAGGGAEVMLSNNLSLGLEYLYTDVKDDDYVANLGAAAAPNLGNLVVGAGGVDVQRSSENFRNHSVRGTLNFRF